MDYGICQYSAEPIKNGMGKGFSSIIGGSNYSDRSPGAIGFTAPNDMG